MYFMQVCNMSLSSFVFVFYVNPVNVMALKESTNSERATHFS